jgi:hypothetical protein
MCNWSASCAYVVLGCARTVRTTLLSNLASYFRGRPDRGLDCPLWRSNARRIVVFAEEGAHSAISAATLKVAPASLAPWIFPR